MKRIKLSQNKFALVDNTDYDWLNQWKWTATQHGEHNIYAIRSWRGDKKRHVISMQRLILGVSSAQLVDHINGNGLDNRRENLRTCTHQQNMQNARKHRQTASGFKGVRRNNGKNTWRVSIFHNNKEMHLGMFFCVIKAAKAYDEAAIKYFGEFANTNFNLELNKRRKK